MDTQLITEACTRHGVVPQAMQRVVEQVLAHYPDKAPSPVEVEGILHLIPVWDKLAMSQETFYAMPPAWRIAQARRMQAVPPGPHLRTLPRRELTGEELVSLEGLPWADRLSRARELQQTPVPPQAEPQP